MIGHVPKMVLAAALLALAACQKPDVGQPCTLTWGTSEPKPNATTVNADYFESGNTTCENLICILSPVAAGSRYDRGDLGGYCSKACGSDGDCYKSDTDLVCRKVVLDEVFLAQLPDDLKQQYLGEIQLASYCVAR